MIENKKNDIDSVGDKILKQSLYILRDFFHHVF